MSSDIKELNVLKLRGNIILKHRDRPDILKLDHSYLINKMIQC